MVVEFLALFLAFLFILLRLRLKSKTNNRYNLPPSPVALPVIGHFHLIGPLIHRSFSNLSFRYGPFFSLHLGSVPCVVASSPEYAKECLKQNELSFISRLHSAAIEKLSYNYSSLAFSPYGPYYKFVKKMSLNELLGNRTLNGFASVRAEEYRQFFGLLAEKARVSEQVNLTEELLKLSNNVISRMMLGSAEEAREVVRDVTRIFGEFNVSDFVWVCKNLDLQGFGKRIKVIYRNFDALVEKILREREELRTKKKKMKMIRKEALDEVHEDGKEVKDFLDMLLDISEDESSEIKITHVHIKALILDFFVAGTDTTSVSSEWALSELINNPHVLAKAQKEIDTVVGRNRLVKESDGPNIPYIQAILKETFRLHPPIPTVARQSVQECKIENYVIPPGTLLFVNSWAMGRDPNIWDSPLEFRPERFLQSSEGKGSSGSIADVRGQHFNFLPFGSGRRICPGIPLALQMVPTVVAGLIQCFDWTVHEKIDGYKGGLDMEERPGLTAPRARDLKCIPVERFNLVGILDR